ncbi:MAG: hypothetical protein JXR44_04620 [Thiotrichales bacterium]|nr:hypothetical protein [Thiotrichales bacterium]
MQKSTLQIAVFSALVVFEGVAVAASISTRVRVLETQNGKQDQALGQLKETQQQQHQQWQETDNRIQLLERKVQGLDQQLQKPKAAEEPAKKQGDKRYAYP